MKYFTNCRTLDELKKEYRRLAMLNHPDRGGDEETMKAINNEYDAVFPAFRLAYNQTAETPTTETAASTRSEFYTQNGWKGSRYDSSRSLKEIAEAVRQFVKEQFPTYKFSVRTHYASMCQELLVEMKEAPCKVYKDFSELTDFIKNLSVLIVVISIFVVWPGNGTDRRTEKIEAARQEGYREGYDDGYERGAEDQRYKDIEELTIDARSIRNIASQVYEVYGMTPSEAFGIYDEYTYDSSHGGFTWAEYQEALEVMYYTASIFPFEY